MNVDNYLQHVPGIEARIRNLRPQALVVGLGPSAWLLPWLDQSLLDGVQLYGANDCPKLWPDSPCPVQDIVVMDPPWHELDPRGARFKHIAESRPERLWIFRPRIPVWSMYLSEESKTRVEALDLHIYKAFMGVLPEEIPRLTEFPYAHIAVTPAGSTTLAWSRGHRRIGVIGMDLLPGHHKMARFFPLVSWFFGHMAAQAERLGGEIANMSTFSAVRSFEPNGNRILV